MLKNIYFLDYKLLALKLSQNKISEHDAVKYFILGLILSGSSISLPVEIIDQDLYSSFAGFISPFITFIIAAIINIFGVWHLYRVNNSGDGKDFFKRIICLSLPVSIYLFLIFLVPSLAIILWATSQSNRILYIIYEFVFIITFLLLYYRFMYKCLIFVSSTGVHENANKPVERDRA